MKGKQLLLLRHAKSSWRDATLADHDRPLNRRGRSAAALMGRFLVEEALVPDMVLCSTAIRARTTWDLATKAFGGKAPKTNYSRDLYHAAPSELLYRIQEVNDDVGRLLLVGHNPGMELLAQRLAGPESDVDEFERMQEKFPTAALALFEVTARSWRNLQPDLASLIAFTAPTDLQVAAA